MLDEIRLSDARRSLERREIWVRENQQILSDKSRLFRFRETCDNLITPEEECPPITSEEVKKALRGSKNNSAAGPVGIKCFW